MHECFQILPFAYVLMTRKTAAAYRVVLTFLKERLPPRLRLAVIMTDYEAVLYISLMNAYPESEVHGCYFHYCQVTNCS